MVHGAVRELTRLIVVSEWLVEMLLKVPSTEKGSMYEVPALPVNLVAVHHTWHHHTVPHKLMQLLSAD